MRPDLIPPNSHWGTVGLMNSVLSFGGFRRSAALASTLAFGHRVRLGLPLVLPAIATKRALAAARSPLHWVARQTELHRQILADVRCR